MLAPLQTGAARFSSYLLSRARKVLGSHLLSPCGVPELCSISTRKLAAHGFGAAMAAMVPFPPQRYHYFLVLDFEATCDKPQIHPQVTAVSLLQQSLGGREGGRRGGLLRGTQRFHISHGF
jgi:ERI1 exoribonuclease 3